MFMNLKRYIRRPTAVKHHPTEATIFLPFDVVFINIVSKKKIILKFFKNYHRIDM